MKTIMLAAALIAAAIGSAAPVQAQQKAPIYRYCLVPAGGWGMTCDYNTLAQCIASRTSFSDNCIVNPRYPARR